MLQNMLIVNIGCRDAELAPGIDILMIMGKVLDLAVVPAPAHLSAVSFNQDPAYRFWCNHGLLGASIGWPVETSGTRTVHACLSVATKCGCAA